MTQTADTDTTTDRKPTGAAADGRLRLVVFSDAFRHRNGVGAYYCDLLDSLDHSVQAQLVCPGPSPPGCYQARQGLSIPLPGDATQRLCLPGVLKALRVMREIQPDVVLGATPGPYGILGMMLARRFKTPFCMAYHTQYDKLVDMYWNRVFRSISGRYLRWMDRRLFNRARLVLTNSEHMVAAATELGAREVRLMGTPVEPRLLRDPTPPATDSFGPVLFVGRLAHEKNIDVFLDAARQLQHIPFVIAGDGPLADEVSRTAAELDNVEYLGWVGREQLVETLDQAEMLMLPSHVESFGTVAIEAMARGRMTMVSEHCGIIAWPTLKPGLEILYDDQSPVDALQALADLSADERAAKCARARTQCQAFVQETLDYWLATLREAADDTARG